MRRAFFAAASLAGLVLAPIAAPSLAFGQTTGAEPSLTLDDYGAGRSASHRVTFTISAGQLEVRRAVLSYPAAFRFLGFHELGPVNTPVGAYELDVDFDGTPERVFPLRSLGSDSAYVDLVPDGVFSPGIEPDLRHTGDGFRLRLPFGGDANADTVTAAFDARLAFVLFHGLLVNPDLGGVHTVTARVLSVDPDTGGPDDEFNEPPEVRTFDVPVSIDGPVVEPLAALVIDKFDFKPHGARSDRVLVHGRFVLGSGTDGVDLSSDRVVVAFNGFRQAIPGDAFVEAGALHHFSGPAPGITSFRLFVDGRFQIDVRDLSRVERGPVTTFALWIGNDRGEVTIAVDSGRAAGRKEASR